MTEAGDDLDAACARLVDLANERGGRDNATVLILRCDAPDEGTATRPL